MIKSSQPEAKLNLSIAEWLDHSKIAIKVMGVFYHIKCVEKICQLPLTQGKRAKRVNE